MKKLNNKGITLIELIVSFAIVSVAMVYFYQTLYTVRKLYVTAQTETEEFVDKDYAVRIVDKYIDEKGTSNISRLCNTYSLKYHGEKCKTIIINHTSRSNVVKITINWEINDINVSEYFYKNIHSIPKKESILAMGNNSVGNDSNQYFFNGTQVIKSDVKSIKFSSSIEKPDGYDENSWWDASEKQNETVKAWYKSDSEGYYEVTIGGYGGVEFPSDSKTLFNYFINLEFIDFSYVDTSNVTNMYSMFNGCKSLINLDLSSFDTRQVQNMNSMFNNCSSLEELDISSFDTGQVQNMISMFNNCSSLKELDISSFDTRQVQNMGSMFNNCRSLEKLDLSSFDTRQVQNMGSMFNSCGSLEELDISSFNTRQVKYMSSMFHGCSKLKTLKLDNFNTELVENMSQMFYSCGSLTKLDLSSFNTSQVKYMDGMFSLCKSLSELKLGSLFVSNNVTNMSQMFYYCESLIKLDLSSFSFTNVSSIEMMFQGCSNLTDLDLRNLDSEIRNLYQAFFGCRSLENLYINKLSIARRYANYANALRGVNKNVKIYVLNSDVKNRLRTTGNVPDSNFLIGY